MMKPGKSNADDNADCPMVFGWPKSMRSSTPSPRRFKVSIADKIATLVFFLLMLLVVAIGYGLSLFVER